MKPFFLSLSLSLLVLCVADLARAGDGDPLTEHLFSPQLVMQHAEAIGLTNDQRHQIQQTAEMAHNRGQQLQRTMRAAVEGLRAELKKEKIDAAAARRALDKVLDAERALKHVHLDLFVTVTNTLTLDQRAALRKARTPSPSYGKSDLTLEARLRAKLEEAAKAAEKKTRVGKSVGSVQQMMKQFLQLMEQGKHKEAENLLDRALDLLRKDADTGPKDDDKGASRNVPPPAPASFATPESLRKKVAALRVPAVAWRKIAWKTCLLDAIAASRATNKPLIVWVFTR